ncbi:MAG: hypothetical protein ABSB41_11540 [Anaerolineales bacterium]
MSRWGSQLRSYLVRWRMAELLAFLGGGVYVAQNVLYAFTQMSEVDEGGYLYQGYLFVTGVYHPFQVNGLWMYYPPFSYLFWGYLQKWFGPGLRTGRYGAICLGILMLLAIWIAARHLGGKWWAAAAIWAVALDPALIKLYSMAESQVLIACMLTWVLALVLGENRPLWQIVASSILAGLVLLTRHNLAPVLPILLVYIFWQHGKKAGWWALACGVLTVAAGYALYWPDILVIWTPWLPAKLTPFLDAFRTPQGGAVLLGTPGLLNRVLAFTTTFRFSYFALAGSLAAIILWPRSDQWKNRVNFRASVFLAALFFTLLVLHLWAAVLNNYCVFCVNPYIAWFIVVALLLVVAFFSEGFKQAFLGRQLIAGLFLLLLFIDLGYASFDVTGFWLMNLRLPRLKTLLVGGGHLQGYAIWDLMESRFQMSTAIARQVVPLIASFMAGLAFLLLTWIVWRFLARRRGYAWMPFSLSIVLILGTVLSPLPVMAGGPRQYDCQADMIRAYEQTGQYLASLIPPGSKVYWDGGGSILPLEYVPGVRILPGQIYDFWSFSPDGDTARVLRFGMWNVASADQWKNEADFILVEGNRYDAGWQAFFLANPQFEELRESPPTSPCVDGSNVRVFRRGA